MGPNLLHNKQGAALAISLMIVIVIIVISTIYVFRAVHEKTMSNLELRTAKAEYTLESGANQGLKKLDELINTNLLNTVNATDPAVLSSQAASYVAANNSVGFLIAYTKSGTTALLTANSSEAVYTGTLTSFDSGTYRYTIRIAAKGNPVTQSAGVWDFPYYYRIQTTAAQGAVNRKVTLNGDFTVRVQKDNFARYALFTNTQTMPDGSNVWFTTITNFAGPMYTNGTYNFATNPGGTFLGTVKQNAATARFYNNGTPVLLNSDHNGTLDVPNFQDGFTRSATAISMPTSSQETSMANEAAGNNSYSSNGIYIPASGSTLTGGIYVRGDATIALSTQGTDTSVITINQGSSSRIIKVNKTTNQTTVTNQSNVTTTYTGVPDGVSNVGQVVYVRGNITSISGTVQKDTQLTIASRDDITIQNNITYEDYTPASGTPGQSNYVPPTAEGANNLLGLLTWQGNVHIGASAPNDVVVHSTLMAKQGIVTVDNYSTGAARGRATVLGGVISNNYGAFGTANFSTGAQLTGYGRNFVYDSRLETEMTPPYFPTMNTFIAFTNDINDKKFWQEGGF